MKMRRERKRYKVQMNTRGPAQIKEKRNRKKKLRADSGERKRK
jgi:hypothetical protein